MRGVTVSVQLTERELKILRMVVAEKRSKEMARELGISKTRLMQIQRILCDKAGVEGRLGLAVWAVRKRLA